MLAPSVLLFLSGASALIYQLLWIKQLSLIVGVDVYAITIAVSAFFAGLAAGSAWFGARADAAPQPLRLYAILEMSAGALGLSATLALGHSPAAFVALQQIAGPLAWILPFVLVGIPATLMGGTLPVLIRSLAPESVARTGGILYAANTLGACAGALAVAFFLIPAFGVLGSAGCAAVLNELVAVAALWLDRRMPSRQAPIVGRLKQRRADDARAALTMYALAGGIALGYEVVWSQVVVPFMSTRGVAFAVMLATYLAGLVTGSAIHARLGRRVRDPWAVFGLLFAAAGLVALLAVAGLGDWILNLQSDAEEWLRGLTGSELPAMVSRFAIAAGAIVFVPTVLLGAAFPAALELGVHDDRIGRDVGRVLAFNTVGGVAGTVLTGFILVPRLGVVHTLAALAMAAAALGIVAAGRGAGGGPVRSATLAVAVLTLLVSAITPADRLARLLPRSRGGGSVVYYNESAEGTVAVVENDGSRAFRRLYVQGVSNSGDAMPSLRYMRLQALLPLLIHRGEPRSALVVGFGTGITAGALLQYPGLERRVCAELLPAIVAAAPFFRGNFHAGTDPRLEIRLRDGRRELLANAERYDLITLEPPPPSAAGVVNLYSRDFYELASGRLNEHGLLAQWWPLPTQNDEDSRQLVRSFVDAFPYASLWTTELHEMLLVGSAEPIQLDVHRIASRFAQPTVSNTLADVGIDSPASLLATWVSDRDGLLRYVGNATAVTDDRPSIEYATWVRRGEFQRVLPVVLSLQTAAPILSADALFMDEMAERHTALRHFYDAALAAVNGDRKSWSRELALSLKAEPGNSYFRWIAGGIPVEGDSRGPSQ